MELIAASKHRGCRPPVNTTYLTIGQDLFSVYDYLIGQFNSSIHSNHQVVSNITAPAAQVLADFSPAAFMVYTDLQSLMGLDQPTDYGSGVQYADGLLSILGPDHDIGLQIGLWLNGTYGCKQILRGELDTQIFKLFQYIAASSARKVFLRVGYEFDNPWFGYSDEPETFVLTYQHIVNRLLSFDNRTHHHARNKIQFVWHSWAAPTNIPDDNNTLESFQRFYPGDEYVDWIGVSIFQQVYPWLNTAVHSSETVEVTNEYAWAGSLEYVESVLDFAQLRNRPTMIAESTPFGGIHLLNEFTVRYNDTDPWDRWYTQVLSLIEKYDIGMWSYIDCNWDSLPMWQGIGFGDTRISSDSRVMKQWQDLVMRNPRFLLGNTMDLCSHNEDVPHEEIPVTIIVIPAKKKHESKDTSSNQNSNSRYHPYLYLFSAFLLVYLWFRRRGGEGRRNQRGNRDETAPLRL